MLENKALRPSWLPLAAALVSVSLWSAAFVGIRAAGRAFSPGALALGRLTIGTLLLGVLLLRRGWTRPTRRDLGLLLIAGITWFGLYSVVLNEAERRVDAGTASMLIMVAPIVVVALAAVFLKERFTRALVLGAAVSCAIGLVAQKPVLSRLSALQVAWTCCAVGALFCLPYAPLLVRELATADTAGIRWLVFLGVFPTSVAFTTWAYALASGTAGSVVATSYLIPAVTIVMSWAILGEVPGLIAVLGGALCFVGVYITRRK